MATDSTKSRTWSKIIERELDVDGWRWSLIIADILAPGLFDEAGAIKR